MTEGDGQAPAPPRRCRRRGPQPRPGDLRPTDVVGAFFLAGGAFLLAAAVAAVVQWLSPWPWGLWLTLHLAFVGGVSQLVLGASQFFVTAFLATEPPPRALLRLQLAAWNAGALLLALAVPDDRGALVWIAVALLGVALAAWGWAVGLLRRRALRRSPWATRWYLAATCFLGLGLIAGSLLAHGTPWSSGDLLAAHMALNLGGFFGGAIVGTLHTFYPSLTRTELRLPRLQGPTFFAWCGGIAALAIGYGFSVESLVLAGWLGLLVAATLLLVNLAASLRRAVAPLSLPARLLGIAHLFLLVGVGLLATLALVHGPQEPFAGGWRTAAGTLLVVGWVGLTVLGSLLHLLAVVLRVRSGHTTRMPAPRPWFDVPLCAAAALGVGGLAVAQAGGPAGLGTVARPLVLLAYAILAAAVAARALRVVTSARPSL
ncbi:MAG: hypothetical protein JSS68_16025 [Actinobacteria bacterium]|nr:hypothetical protein [Actinomycetota bacterium]